MIFGFDDFELDADRLELRRSGNPIKANAVGLRLLRVLVQNAGQLVTKDELVAQVWDDRAVADNVITVSMARLRKMLGHRRGDREYVVTIYGRGYRFAREVSARALPAASVRPAESPREVAPPFVGRERALGRLRAALAEARGGRGRVCALMGEPGIGKTRAVEALERELAGSPSRVAWGYCREAGDTPPLWPWLRLLREATAASGPADEPLADELRSLLHEPLSAPPDDGMRHRVFDAALRAITLAAQQAPWVLVLDDLHRADAASIELLSLLVDEIAHIPLLVIATLRHAPGRRAPRPDTYLPQVLGHRNTECITLERLSSEDVATYVAAMVDDAHGQLAQAVFAKSEGNPFFMVELSRQLCDAEQPSAAALTVSNTALELIRQAIARLGADTREVLSAAAAIGRSFELSLLAEITGREPSQLIASVDEALAAEVLVAAPDSTTAFAFGHELLRAVSYDELSAADQRRWHLRIGPALEQRRAAGKEIAVADIAYHFHAALPDGDLRKTVDYCRRAAAAAGAVFAGPDVVRYGRRALAALDLMEHPSVRLRSNLLFMMALYSRGDGIEFPRTIREVIRIAHEQDDGPGLVRAASMLNPHPGFQPIAGATEALTRALPLLAPDDGATRAIALAGLAVAAPQCFDAERCHALIDEACALGRSSGSGRSLRLPLMFKLYLQGGPAQPGLASALVEEVQRLWEQDRSGAPVLPAELGIHHAIEALQRGDTTRIPAVLEQTMLRCQEVRHGELLWHCERYQVLARVNAGNRAGAAADLAALHRRAELRPIIGTAPFCAFDRTVVFAELDEPVRIDAPLRAALARDAADPPSLWALKVRALATAGLTEQAMADLRAVSPAELARLPCDTAYLGTLGHLARAALLLGARDYTEAVHGLLARHPDHYAAHVSFLCEGAVPQLLGMLERVLGDHAQAAAHLETGVHMNESAGLAARAAEARLQLARCLLEQGGRGARKRALALASEALAEASRLGMQRLATEASSLPKPGG